MLKENKNLNVLLCFFDISVFSNIFGFHSKINSLTTVRYINGQIIISRCFFSDTVKCFSFYRPIFWAPAPLVRRAHARARNRTF